MSGQFHQKSRIFVIIPQNHNTIPYKEMSNNTRLFNLLDDFNGAKQTQYKSKAQNLLLYFEQIAKEMIYGGYIRVRDDYAIFISKVEFYYHEEDATPGEGIIDGIVYHRDGRFINRDVPYFPIMTLHSHWSGFDIAFEKESGHYRASALIRQYAVLDLKKRMFIELKTSGDIAESLDNEDEFRPVGEVRLRPTPVIDVRSTYPQYFLNGFSMNGNDSRVEWRNLDNPEYHQVKREYRKNANKHDWGYIYKDKKDYEAAILRLKETL